MYYCTQHDVFMLVTTRITCQFLSVNHFLSIRLHHFCPMKGTTRCNFGESNPPDLYLVQLSLSACSSGEHVVANNYRQAMV